MNDVKLFVPGPQDVPELGHICFEAFRQISRQHERVRLLQDSYNTTSLSLYALLYRAVLKSGCRLSKVMNLMALGPYEDPTPVWMPSIAF
jgi:hypothetical protein